jgi:PiT family inorganic phosphate transporter
MQAVAWAASFNFIAAFIFGTHVAATIGTGLIKPDAIDIYVVLAGLIGAIVWNIITWLLALPTSSSHALVSGAAGAAIAKSGFGVLVWQGWAHGWGGLLLFIILSPLIGFILGGALMIAVAWIFRRTSPHTVDRLFRRLQLVSAGIYSLGHGGNDAQKTMGIIVLLLGAGGYAHWSHPDPRSFMERFFAFLHYHAGSTVWLNRFIELFHHNHTVAWWIILSCNAAIALGTLFGGWRIVKTMGSGITRLQPVGGFCAEAAAATTIIAATHGGIPISTTHAITGSILGVGTTHGVRSVRWIWGQRIVTAWVLTLPCAAFIAAVAYGVIHLTIEAFMG